MNISMKIARYRFFVFMLLIICNFVSKASELEYLDSRPSLISEFRIGLLAHNVGPIATKEEQGVDLNLELLFQSPSLFDSIGEPRPIIGTSINSVGDTSFVYSGLMWNFDISTSFFTGVSFGMAIHNGNSGDVMDEEGLRALGCWWLFRESIEIGFRLNKQISIALFLDHVSHGGLCSDANFGMDNTGLRLHYKF